MQELKFAGNVKVEQSYLDTDSKRKWIGGNYYRDIKGFVDIRDEFTGWFLSWTPLHCRYLNNSGFYEVDGMSFSGVWKLLGDNK
jgi:hypothetical protein